MNEFASSYGELIEGGADDELDVHGENDRETVIAIQLEHAEGDVVALYPLDPVSTLTQEALHHLEQLANSLVHIGRTLDLMRRRQ